MEYFGKLDNLIQVPQVPPELNPLMDLANTNIRPITTQPQPGEAGITLNVAGGSITAATDRSNKTGSKYVVADNPAFLIEPTTLAPATPVGAEQVQQVQPNLPSASLVPPLAPTFASPEEAPKVQAVAVGSAKSEQRYVLQPEGAGLPTYPTPWPSGGTMASTLSAPKEDAPLPPRPLAEQSGGSSGSAGFEPTAPPESAEVVHYIEPNKETVQESSIVAAVSEDPSSPGPTFPEASSIPEHTYASLNTCTNDNDNVSLD